MQASGLPSFRVQGFGFGVHGLGAILRDPISSDRQCPEVYFVIIQVGRYPLGAFCAHKRILGFGGRVQGLGI